MNTTHMRLCSTLLRDSEESGAADLLNEAADEIDRLRADRRLIAHTERGDVWYWQGDGYDFPESLACPVVIDGSVLCQLLNNAKAVDTKYTHKDDSVTTESFEAWGMIYGLMHKISDDHKTAKGALDAAIHKGWPSDKVEVIHVQSTRTLTTGMVKDADNESNGI